jgi:hypothetical protein
LSNDQADEDEEAVLQEQEVMASPDIEPVEELEEGRSEAETEVEEEDRESDEIEEREDEMASESKKSPRRNGPGKGSSHRGSARKRTKGQGARRPTTVSKKH